MLVLFLLLLKLGAVAIVVIESWHYCCFFNGEHCSCYSYILLLLLSVGAVLILLRIGTVIVVDVMRVRIVVEGR